MIRALAMLWAVLIGLGNAHAADVFEPYFQPVGDRSSIVNGNVTAIAQDTSGMLWVGLPEGLVRYDGYRFRHFKHDRDRPGSLGGDQIYELLAGSDGRIWVATASDGVSVFDPRSEQFRVFRHQPHNSASLDGNSVRALAEDADGGIWVGTGSGLNRIDPRSGMVERIPLDASNTQQTTAVRDLLFDRRGGVWISGDIGLWYRPTAVAPFRRLAPCAREDAQPYALAEDAQHNIWFSERGRGIGVIRLTVDGAMDCEFVHDASGEIGSGITLTKLLVVGDRELWVGTGSGIAIIDMQAKRVDHWLRHDPADPGSIGGSQIQDLMLDPSGLLWVGGFGSGLQRYNARNTAIGVARQSYHRSSGLSDASVRSIVQSQSGILWLGSDTGGVDFFSLELGRVGGIRPGGTTPSGLPRGTVTGLTEAPDGSLWIGSVAGDLLRSDQLATQLQPVTISRRSANELPFALTSDRSGRLWLGTGAHVYRVDTDGLTAEPVALEDGSEFQEYVTSIAEAPDGAVWIGGRRRGLSRIPPGKSFIEPVLVPAAGAGSRSHSAVEALLWDSAQRLWTDSGGGLDRMLEFDGRTARFERTSERLRIGGQPFGGCLLEDGQGRIWSYHYVFDPATEQLHELTEADGAVIGTGWFRSCAKLRDGRLAFGGSKGMMLIDPERHAPWDYQPPLVISAVWIDGQQRPLGTLQPRLLISPEQRAFAVEFSALDLSDPTRNRYAFRLEPYDAEWITSDAAHRLASYSNLPPGEYLLRVRGSNRVGQYSPTELAIPVRVLPAFWQTWWFRALVLLLLAALLAMAVRLRTAQIRDRARRLEAIVEQRTTELQSSHAKVLAANHALEAAHHHLLETQKQLVLQEKMASLGILTAGVAHEINNPTNFADGAVQNLEVELERLHGFLRDLAGDAEPEVLAAFQQRFKALAEMTGTAREGHRRIKSIVQDLRQFTRLDEAGRKPAPIAEPIESTVKLVRTRFDRIEFILDLAYNPTIQCHPAKLGQVFMNLIVNACDAICACNDGRRGRVRIVSSAIRDGGLDQVQIVVEDNGLGMDPATRARVFEPFFTTKPVGAGTGLGLAVCHGIVDEHGGSLNVESQLGVGSRFTLRLPLTTA